MEDLSSRPRCVLDGGKGPCQVPDAPAGLSGPRHWVARPQAGTTTLRIRPPGDLIHVDIKKLGRIPQGGGYRSLGRAKGRKNRRAGTGYVYLHHVVDDHSRLAYSEILADEKKETATAFWLRAASFFAAHGITIRAVLTDNGALLPLKSLHRSLGTEHQAPQDSPLPATDQWQSRTLQPNPHYGMGLRPTLHIRSPTGSHLSRLATSIQSPQDPYRHRRFKLPSAAFTASVGITPRASTSTEPGLVGARFTPGRWSG
jgi:hypothetical protein